MYVSIRSPFLLNHPSIYRSYYIPGCPTYSEALRCSVRFPPSLFYFFFSLSSILVFLILLWCIVFSSLNPCLARFASPWIGPHPLVVLDLAASCEIPQERASQQIFLFLFLVFHAFLLSSSSVFECLGSSLVDGIFNACKTDQPAKPAFFSLSSLSI